VVAVVQLSVQSPVRRWEATGGIRVAIIIGATVVAGSVHQVADRTRYRAGIAADICLSSRSLRIRRKCVGAPAI
jgi:hypothetical protein